MKTFLLFAFCLICSFHAPARAEMITTPLPNFDGALLGVRMQDAKNGWATGQTEHTVLLLRTEDGGKSWADVSPQSIRKTQPLSLIGDASFALRWRFNNPARGWAMCVRDLNEPLCDEFNFFSTVDGGKHWQQNPFNFPAARVGGIELVDEKCGFVAVESKIDESDRYPKAVYRTVDGGRTWQAVSQGTPDDSTKGALPSSGRLGEVAFRDDQEGWISVSPTGDQKESFFHTKDGGATWQPQTLPRPQGEDADQADYVRVVFSGARKMEGIATVRVGHGAPGQGSFAFYGTRDGGEHWELTGTPPVDWEKEKYVTTMFSDADHGWMVTSHDLFATTDRGATWSKVESNLPFEQKRGTWVVQFVSSSQGWLDIGKFEEHPPYTYRPELLQTVDGGHTWTHCYGASLLGAAE